MRKQDEQDLESSTGCSAKSPSTAIGGQRSGASARRLPSWLNASSWNNATANQSSKVDGGKSQPSSHSSAGITNDESVSPSIPGATAANPPGISSSHNAGCDERLTQAVHVSQTVPESPSSDVGGMKLQERSSDDRLRAQAADKASTLSEGYLKEGGSGDTRESRGSRGGITAGPKTAAYRDIETRENEAMQAQALSGE